MTGTEKAAILLLYLGTDVTSRVFQYMEDNQIKRISQAMGNLGHVSLPVIQDVVEEYNEITNPESGFFSQGDEFVKKILEKALGQQKAEMLLSELHSTDFSDIEDILGSMDAKSISNFLSQEHPQTIAVVVAKLRPKQTSEIISALPNELQAEVVIRIADVDQISPEILGDIDDVLRKELTAMGGIKRYQVGGVDKVVELFNHFDRSHEKQILDKLDVMNPPLAEMIRKHLFTFEDIFKMDDRTIQGVMREVSNDTLTLAMKTSPEDVKEKIFKNISSRAADMIKEDLEVMGPVRLSDVEKAQSEIIKIVRKMEEEGKVVLGRGSEDVLV